MINVLFFFSLLSVSEVFAETKCPVNFCNGTRPAADLVEHSCKSKEGVMDGRCCSVNDIVIGLDLRSCDIGRLNITSYNFTDVTIMDLRINAHLNVTNDDLKGLLDLNELYLPPGVPCPGGNDSWDVISLGEEMTKCQDQINPCKALNISCTQNGECLHTGPGSAKCICLPGHYGYKCLNEGEFPSTVFSVSLLSSTIFLCVALWFAVGRDAHKNI